MPKRQTTNVVAYIDILNALISQRLAACVIMASALALLLPKKSETLFPLWKRYTAGIPYD